jgi:hypothetical protein
MDMGRHEEEVGGCHLLFVLVYVLVYALVLVFVLLFVVGLWVARWMKLGRFPSSPKAFSFAVCVCVCVVSRDCECKRSEVRGRKGMVSRSCL